MADLMSHLSVLEEQERKRNTKTQQNSQRGVEDLKATVDSLTIQRDQLKAEIAGHNTFLQKLKTVLYNGGAHEENEDMDNGSENSQSLRLMAQHAQLKDLLRAHHLIGGYDLMKTRDKKVCISLATEYGGVYLETYNLEIELREPLRISRHNIPPFIPLKSLAEQSLQTDIRGFLDTLSLHLNAYSGRKQQIKLIKEHHTSVEVMESNAPCSILVLMLTLPKENTKILCTLNYSDVTSCLPTKVVITSDDKLDSQQWKKNHTLLMETPVHTALTTIIGLMGLTLTLTHKIGEVP